MVPVPDDTDDVPRTYPDEEHVPNTTTDGAWTCPRCPWTGTGAAINFDTDHPLLLECPECSKPLVAIPTYDELADHNESDHTADVQNDL